MLKSKLSLIVYFINNNCKGKFKQLLYYSKDMLVDGPGRIQFLHLGLMVQNFYYM